MVVILSFYSSPNWPGFADYTDDGASEGGDASGKDDEPAGKLCESSLHNSPLPNLI